jgi:hypothetical protein
MTRLTALVVLITATVAAALVAADDDPIKVKLEKARANYDKKVDKFRGDLLKSLQAFEKSAQKAGNKPVLDRVREERKALEANGTIPTVVPSNGYKRLLEAADDMAKAYTQAMKDYTKAGMDREAEAVERERIEFRQGLSRMAPQMAATRRELDKLLIVKCPMGNILGSQDWIKEGANLGAAVFQSKDGDKVYISQAYGRQDVLCSAPLSQNEPATIDFGKITRGTAGKLGLLVHGHPSPRGQGGRVVVRADGVAIRDVSVDSDDGWLAIEVPFRRADIVVEHHPIGWAREMLYFDYAIH